MQPSPIPQTWSQFVTLLTGIFIGLIPEIYRTYRDRKKSSLDQAEIAARTGRTQAESRSLQLRDDIATGEFVEKALGTMMSATDKLHEQQERIFDLEQDKIELVMRREEVRRMKALLVLNGIPYSDADKFRVK